MKRTKRQQKKHIQKHHDEEYGALVRAHIKFDVMMLEKFEGGIESGLVAE